MKPAVESNVSRVDQTRQRLRTALVSLTVRHGYEHVTARQIALEAGVGFKTLYRHYANKEELLLEILTELAVEVHERLQLDTDALLVNARSLFTFIKEEEDRCRILIDPLVATLMVQPLLPLVERLSEGFFVPSEPLADSLLPLLHEHILWTTMGLVRRWLVGGMQTPLEVMAQLYVALVTQPINDLKLGVGEGEG